MRWDDLFDDLEGQAEAGDRAAWEAVLADLVSAERAAVRMLDRIRASRDPLTLRLVDGQVLAGPVVEVGEDWLILGVEEVLVPITAVVTVERLSRAAVVGGHPVERALTVASVFRRMARDRCAVDVRLVGGTGLHGTVDGVGADHLDLACHPAGEPRTAAAVLRTVPVSAVTSVRRR
ncbi:MAG: hypothetical protein GXX79_05755 [Actinomycetales bacterium]|nr:hypothetical protein [Actinomycetales bacterium]